MNKPPTPRSQRYDSDKKRWEQRNNRGEDIPRPHDADAEMATLGAILGDPDNIPLALGIVQPDDFYIERHRLMYAAIIRLYERDQPADLVTLVDELRTAGELDDAGGQATVSSVVNHTPHIFRVEQYARIVAKTADRRRALDIWSQSLKDLAASDADPLTAMGRVMERYKEAQDRILSREGESLRQVVSLADLESLELPEPNWAVEGLLPEGFTLLAGDPKIGKSWMAMSLGLSVAFGGPVFGTLAPSIKGAVLGLFLEDSLRRIRDRSQMLLAPDDHLPSNFDVFVEPITLETGGLVFLENWLRAHADARLIIIDTVQRFRGFGGSGDGNMYAEDYEAMTKIQHLAISHHVAIVGLHHLNKSETSSPVRQISGSMGVAGGVDNTWILKRDADQDTGSLYMTGRDIDENTYALVFDKTLCQWKSLGLARDYAANESEKAVLAYLHTCGRPAGPSELAQALGVNQGTMRSNLSRMLGKKLVACDENRKYSALVY